MQVMLAGGQLCTVCGTAYQTASQQSAHKSHNLGCAQPLRRWHSVAHSGHAEKAWANSCLLHDRLSSHPQLLRGYGRARQTPMITGPAEGELQVICDLLQPPTWSSCRCRYLSWDEYFMSVAILSAQRSKDPNKQARSSGGAVPAMRLLGSLLSFATCMLEHIRRRACCGQKPMSGCPFRLELQ